MIIKIGDACCHDATDEPLYQVRPASSGNLECTCATPCKVSYFNSHTKKESYEWTACTF